MLKNIGKAIVAACKVVVAICMVAIIRVLQLGTLVYEKISEIFSRKSTSTVTKVLQYSAIWFTGWLGWMNLCFMFCVQLTLGGILLNLFFSFALITTSICAQQMIS